MKPMSIIVFAAIISTSIIYLIVPGNENKKIPEEENVISNKIFIQRETLWPVEETIAKEELAGEDRRIEPAELPSGTILSKNQLEALDSNNLFYQQEISEALFQRIYGKSFKENCTVPREDLVYIRVLYYGFDEETHIGELISNRNISKDLIEIFNQLYTNEYPIEKMVLIDDYDADDERSMADNNTSCFNFRKISGSTSLSKHSMGYAVDINPLYNPYIRTMDGKEICEPENGMAYMDRVQNFPYKIDESDLCCRLFKQYGFAWGGDWNSVKDYQHFEKIVH